MRPVRPLVGTSDAGAEAAPDDVQADLTSVTAVVRFLPTDGDVAQLGERRVRNAKVEGSNPFVSSGGPHGALRTAVGTQ